MMVLFGQINTLYTKLAHLDKQIQIHCIYPHSQLDAIQLNAPDYNPDIDGEPDSVTAVQPLNADSVKEDTFTGTTKSEYMVSTLLTLKKLKINNTALTIPSKVLNIIFLSQIIITTKHNQNSTRDSKIKIYTYPHPPLLRT